MNLITSRRESFLNRLLSSIPKPIAEILHGEGLKARVFRGGAWLGTGSFAEQVIRFGRNMVLARLLAPDAFGMMAIVLSACSVLHTLMDIGVREALIQNPRGSEDEYVGAAWWMAFGRALSFGIFISIAAPFVAKFYGNAELSPLFRVSAIGVLFDGAVSSRAYVAIREMKFRKWAVINHGGAICGVLITVILSFYIRDAWALVIGYSSESVGRSVLSFAVCPYLPPRKVPMAAVRDLLSFSRKAFGLALLNLIFARTDIFVLAKLRSATDLGLYSMAIYLVQTPASFLTNILGQTLLPAFSQVQQDKARTNRILIHVTSALVLVGMPAFVFMFFCGRSLITLVYGARYASATAPLIAASAVTLVNVLNAQITTIFYARGLPQLHRRCVLVMAIMMIVLIYPFAKLFGLVGGQLACLISIVVGYVFQLERVHHITDLDMSRYGRVFIVGAGLSLLVAAICLFTRPFVMLNGPAPNILFGILGCILAYSLIATILFKNKWDVVRWDG
jgi:lipopolysaccharide exporter